MEVARIDDRLARLADERSQVEAALSTGTLAAATDVLAGESVWLSCGAIAKLFHLRLTAIRVENLENQTGAP